FHEWADSSDKRAPSDEIEHEDRHPSQHRYPSKGQNDPEQDGDLRPLIGEPSDDSLAVRRVFGRLDLIPIIVCGSHPHFLCSRWNLYGGEVLHRRLTFASRGPLEINLYWTT